MPCSLRAGDAMTSSSGEAPWKPHPARIVFSGIKVPVCCSDSHLLPQLPQCASPLQSELFKAPVAAAASFLQRLLPRAQAKREPLLKSLHAQVLGFIRQRAPRRIPLFCSASLSAGERACERNAVALQHRNTKEEEERVLISEVLVQDKDGQELECPDLLATARQALKSCKSNYALTTKEVQEDVHRIIETGYFASCMPVAEDTRDGVRLIFKVEANQELRGLVCNGANVLPTKVIEDAFRNEYGMLLLQLGTSGVLRMRGFSLSCAGKVVNIQRLNRVLDTLNGWYRDRGYFAQVTDLEILSDGVLRVQFAEAVVNNINIRFLDRKTGEPTVGRTRPETLLRQLTTKKGQVYSLQQGRRDAETVFTMGIMEDVNIVPQAAGDTVMADLTMNVVERVPGGFSAGGGLSGNGMTNGALSGLVGSFAYSHRNVFGWNQKLNISLERDQVNSMFRINYTDHG